MSSNYLESTFKSQGNFRPRLQLENGIVMCILYTLRDEWLTIRFAIWISRKTPNTHHDDGLPAATLVSILYFPISRARVVVVELNQVRKALQGILIWIYTTLGTLANLHDPKPTIELRAEDV